MKKIVRLTESDLVRIVKRVINEQSNLKVKIISATGDSWYKNLVGKEVTVIDQSGPLVKDYYKLVISDDIKKYLSDPNVEHFLLKKDCQVVR